MSTMNESNFLATSLKQTTLYQESKSVEKKKSKLEDSQHKYHYEIPNIKKEINQV